MSEFENGRLTLPQLAHPWRARYAPSFIQAARTATSTIPNSVEVNQVPDANRIQSNCSK